MPKNKIQFQKGLSLAEFQQKYSDEESCRLALFKASHQVILGTSERFRGFVESHGLTYGHMDDGLLAIIDTEQGRSMLENTTNIFDVVKQNIKLGKQL